MLREELRNWELEWRKVWCQLNQRKEAAAALWYV